MIAEVLWRAALEPDAKAKSAGRVRGLWRHRVYGPVRRRAREQIASHRSPEPWLTVQALLEHSCGDFTPRATRRFQGVQGGEASEHEYQRIRQGDFVAPYVFAAGYPRTGTTTVQNVVRTYFGDHFPEAVSVGRYSLWEFGKHSADAAAEIAVLGESACRVVITVREFVDAAASLVIGRGGASRVDVAWEAHLWEQWIGVAKADNVSVLPFGMIEQLGPDELAVEISTRCGLAMERPSRSGLTHSEIFGRTGRGSIDNAFRSNLPDPRRRDLLREARDYVVRQLGEREADRLSEQAAVATASCAATVPISEGAVGHGG